jgi:hypothetical protein
MKYLKFKENIPDSRKISQIQSKYTKFKENIPNSKQIYVIQSIHSFNHRQTTNTSFGCYLAFRPHPQSSPRPPRCADWAFSPSPSASETPTDVVILFLSILNVECTQMTCMTYIYFKVHSMYFSSYHRDRQRNMTSLLKDTYEYQLI